MPHNPFAQEHSTGKVKDTTMSIAKEETKGLKYDQSKPRMDLMSPIALAHLSSVLTFGAQKYAEHNWRSGIQMSRLISASQRHLTAIQAGIDYDEETALPHAAHLMCCAMFMIEQLYSEKASLMDDRYHLDSDQKNLLAALLAGSHNQTKCNPSN
jgi:hypothetical protein